MIFRKRASKDEDRRNPAAREVARLLDVHMPDADDETRRLVAALAGLLACVAYADREYEPSEQAHIREELGHVHGLNAAGVDAICALLDAEIVELASGNTQNYTRDLRELAALGTRREILEVLVDLAAADGAVTTEETNLLRRATTAMGLEDGDYLAAQARHRERLSVLNTD